MKTKEKMRARIEVKENRMSGKKGSYGGRKGGEVFGNFWNAFVLFLD